MTARANATDISSPEPRIVVSRQGTTSTIQVEGEWDPAVKARMHRAVSDAFGHRPENVVLDLSRATSMQSSGIALVVALAKRCTRHNVRLVIVPGPAAVHHLFQTSDLAHALPFVGGP